MPIFGEGISTVWVVWAAYSDDSGEPTFLAAYDQEPQATALKDLVDRAEPAKRVRISAVQMWPLISMDLASLSW